MTQPGREWGTDREAPPTCCCSGNEWDAHGARDCSQRWGFWRKGGR